MSEVRELIDTELDAKDRGLFQFGNRVAEANNATQVSIAVGGTTGGNASDARLACTPETFSPSTLTGVGSGRAARCAVCDGKFGLIRHHSWRTHLCSKKCVDRFRARRASNRNWLSWFRTALNQAPENRARA